MNDFMTVLGMVCMAFLCFYVSKIGLNECMYIFVEVIVVADVVCVVQ